MRYCNSNASQTRVWRLRPQPPEVLGIWEPPTAGQFFVIFEIKSYFNAIGSHFAHVQSHLKELEFNI